jgi:glutaconate CoA-transferase subunit A
VPQYRNLRDRLQQRDRGLRDKVMSLSEAVALVQDGDHVAIGGNTFSRTPFALVWEIVRQRKRNLEISRSITSTEGDLLLAGDCTRSYLTSWFSQGLPWGISRVMRHYVESGAVRYEEWSHMSLGMMYRAGALGIPFMPTRVMMGSGMVSALTAELETIDCPYTGERLLLLPALNPNVAIIHVQRADRYGNAQYDGLPFMDADIAMAADKVLLTTEEIVSNDDIRGKPEDTRIPFMAVDAVVECPYGSLPHECAGKYDAIYAHMDAYAQQARQDGVDGARRYLEEFVYGLNDWSEYVAKIRQ